ncbi:hypothetical protein [Embleya scabrispora]|uniref:hypothetical protein n=1 Tax=Embleya scabrispora TaxID=159449 RepID=UPI001319DDCA|nr:hypothetical protein [Embleya scabrispora]MYS78831.1 hypothetical protein [Streptomyces sp. SID5474]
MSIETPKITVHSSGDPDHPIRITAPGRDPLDVTRAELMTLVHEGRMRLMRTFPTPPIVGGIPDSGG